MNQRTILITGGNGYVGKQLVAALVGQAKLVISCDVRDCLPNERVSGVTYVKADIRDEGFNIIFREHPIDTVVHLASIVTPGNKSNREFEYSVDVIGTKNVLNACVTAGVKQIIISSSGAAYGYHTDNASWLTETDPIRGNYEIPYSWHKRLVEEMLLEFRSSHPELKQTIFRIGTVLGKTVNNQITSLFEKPRMIGIRGCDSPFVFIWDQDLVAIFLQAIKTKKEGIYNVAGVGALSIQEIATRLGKPVLKLPAEFLKNVIRVLRFLRLTQYSPDQTKFIQYRPVLSNKKLMTEFAYTPQKTSAQVFEYWVETHQHACSNMAKIVASVMIGFFTFMSSSVFARSITVSDTKGKRLSGVMVSQKTTTSRVLDSSDQGFSQPGVFHPFDPETTVFSNTAGTAQLADLKGAAQFHFRKVGFKDKVFTENAQSTSKGVVSVILESETDPILLAEAKPANAWLGALNLGAHFQMQCGFCHQQGNSFTRIDRTEDEWTTLIQRMVGYGSRLPTDLQKSLPKILPNAFRELRQHPELIVDAPPLDAKLSDVSITEWPLGNQMSQMHDLLSAGNGIIYVADNIQDRLYKVDTLNGTYKVHKIPHRDGEKNGGLIAARLRAFPQHDSTSNAHSLARSERDGHVFITPSAQRRLVEFDPVKSEFILHEMPDGFYPHTIRIDQKDRVWFTLALSNQVARFDRDTKKFTLYDLPNRGFREKLITKYIKYLYVIMDWGIPLSRWLKIDWVSTGVPLAYGIDITPDGKAWFTQLHRQSIGSIDPETGKIETFPSPSLGPRRLRSDAEGNLWVTNFGASSISRFDPKTKTFKEFILPVNPLGSETPYSLNVDRKLNMIWVTGNQSDSLFRFNPTNNEWFTIPLPKRTTFTRDIEFDEHGNVFTSNSNFPSWHIETGQPTLIRIQNRKSVHP